MHFFYNMVLRLSGGKTSLLYGGGFAEMNSRTESVSISVLITEKSNDENGSPTWLTAVNR